MKTRPTILIPILIAALVTASVVAAGVGAVSVSPGQVLGIIAKALSISSGGDFTTQQESVIIAIRLPRVVMGMLIGAGLAIAGAALQGLFRNPLADPGIIGVSSGASLAAVAVIVIGSSFTTSLPGWLGTYSLPAASFLGAFVATIIVYRLAQYNGKTLVSTLLLAGIAINAIAQAFTGLFVFFANEGQLRTITFWMLGSLGGATWSQVAGISPFIGIAIIGLPFLAKALNTFALGENNAAFLGIKTEQTKRLIIILAALAVGASVAVSGIIGFVGLVVPHIIRMIIGPDHRLLLVCSALLGAFLLVLSDLFARTVLSPAELPIGIVTAIIGAPVFLYILMKERSKLHLF